MTTCAIHQPNLVPWYPFFQKMVQCDVFVLLTKCQFERQGFQNRFCINDATFTMPVYGVDKRKPIEKMGYVDPTYNWKKILKQMEPLGRRFVHRASMLNSCVSDNLADTNSNMICEMAGWLGLRKTIITDEETDKTGTERLVEICERAGADTYISGPSGRDYLDLSIFEKHDIRVVFQNPENQRRIHTLELLCA